MRREGRPRLGVLMVALGAALLALLLWRVAAPPAGPVEPAWDRVACAHCRMLLTDPRYAAQLHTPAGEVLFFDDPGCLLLHRAEQSEAPAAVWFHDSASSAWLAEAETRFVPAAETPMGYGFAAVADAAAPEGLDAAGALATLRAREASAP